MFASTLPQLSCPKKKKRGKGGVCGGSLRLRDSTETSRDVTYGDLHCSACSSQFPILSGVAILVDDVRGYLLDHVKGISRLVSDAKIPKIYLQDFRQVKAEIEVEHIEEDLEAERVISLYLMNHYLRADPELNPSQASQNWWRADHGESSPLIEQLIRDHWDEGPFAKIAGWLKELHRVESVIELGCGVGGLYREIRPFTTRYLGVDSSFASIALARHLALGAAYPDHPRIPRDLLHGSVSADPGVSAEKVADGSADFVVGDLDGLPVKREAWAMSIALNAIDMMPEPALLPNLQHNLLQKGGIAIQSCPYIWHADVAKELRKILPKAIQDSAAAVEWLYDQAGLKLEARMDHVPWLFYKHARQLEVYSVHLMLSKKP